MSTAKRHEYMRQRPKDAHNQGDTMKTFKFYVYMIKVGLDLV